MNAKLLFADALAIETLDGWSIYPADELVAMGFDAELVQPLVRDHRSNRSDGRSTIWVDGKPVDALRGVYSLDLLWRLAELLDADQTEAGRKVGRGFQADALKSAIRERLLDRKGVRQ